MPDDHLGVVEVGRVLQDRRVRGLLVQDRVQPERVQHPDPGEVGIGAVIHEADGAAGGGAADVAIQVVVLLVGGQRTIAVVVDGVAQLGRAGVSRGVALVAVTVALAVGVAVLVALVESGRAVAVVVEAVAQLRGPQVDEVVGVVAVARARALRVAVVVPAVIHDQVAVVVDAVAQLGGVRVDVHVERLAVPFAGGETVVVEVEVLVDEAVAVVVLVVAELGPARVDGRVVVVAVDGPELEEAVGMRAGDAVVVHVEVFVDQTIAVVVDVVAALDLARVDRGSVGERVVAVPLARGVAVGVLIGEVDADAVVDDEVAVVVDAVAQLGGVGVGRRVVVVAVSEQVADAEAVAVHVQPVVDRAVAVVVELVAELRVARVHRGELIVAVELLGRVVADAALAELVHEAVAVGVEALVHEAVAVVVHEVADLVVARVDPVVGVVAVAGLELRVLAVIGVGVLGAEPVAVLIEGVGVVVVVHHRGRCPHRTAAHREGKRHEQQQSNPGPCHPAHSRLVAIGAFSTDQIPLANARTRGKGLPDHETGFHSHRSAARQGR